VREKKTRKMVSNPDTSLERRGERVKGDMPERGDAMRSTRKSCDATLEREGERVKGDTPERGEATRNTKKYCDATIEKDSVKGDSQTRLSATTRNNYA